MEQLSLNPAENGLFEKISSVEQLEQAYKLVKANRGSPGVDGQTIKAFGENLTEEIATLSQEVREWRYKPHPVRRVEIPKPGKSTEKRKLGVPCVRDRVLYTSIKTSLEPMFEKDFSPNSYGFRPGRDQKQAIQRAKQYTEEGKKWVVDIDLEKFFDTINQDKLMHLLGEKVEDKRVLRLIGMALRSGVLTGDKWEPTPEGSTQGSPLSPLLSNIVLDELDKELERRNLAFCRFADDANIFVGSKKSAERVLESITKFIEKRLKLKVNSEKSKAALASSVKFLGITIVAGMVLISAVSMKRAHAKVRELIPRRTHLPIEKQIEEVNKWYRGWSNYYIVTETPSQLQAIEARIRRRFRAQLVRNSTRRAKRFLVRKLQKRGISKKSAVRAVCANRKTWALSACFAVQNAWKNRWFESRGLYSALRKEMPWWQPLKLWITLT